MKRIPLTQGLVALVDDADYERLAAFSWHAKRCPRSCYAQRKVGTSHESMHRLILNAPKGVMVDHIDGNGLNNQRLNLRLCSQSQNQHNSARPSNNTSGFKGVSWHDRSGKWRARVRLNDRQTSLGLYETREEADSACRAARLRLHGDFARNG